MPFNLIRDAWLPVVDAAGTRALITPAQIADRRGGMPWRSFDTGRPELDMGCLEFAAGLLAVACPASSNEAFSLWYRNPPAVPELEELMAEYTEAFNIDGDGPLFMQDPLPDQLDGRIPIHRLLLASGADRSFFSPDSLTGGEDRPVRFGRMGVAQALFAHQITATSGGRGYRTSPRGGGPLTTVLVPYETDRDGQEGPAPLWQRVWLNVPRSAEAAHRPLAHFFPWMTHPVLFDLTGKVVASDSVAVEQVMFAMPRRVVIEWQPNVDGLACDLTGEVDDVVAYAFRRVHYGLDYPSEAWLHPFTPRIRRKPTDVGTLPILPSSVSDTLGDWVGLTLAVSDRSTSPAPIVAEWMANRSDVVPSVKLHAIGFATDNAKLLDFIDRTVPVIHSADPEVDRVVTRAAQRMAVACDLMGDALRDALKACTFRDKDKGAQKSLLLTSISDLLSRRLSTQFFAGLRDIVADPGAEDRVMKEWPGILGNVAFAIIEDLRPLEDADPDHLGGWLAQRRYLNATIRGSSPMGAKIRSTLGLPPLGKTRRGNDGAGQQEGAHA